MDVGSDKHGATCAAAAIDLPIESNSKEPGETERLDLQRLRFEMTPQGFGTHIDTKDGLDRWPNASDLAWGSYELVQQFSGKAIFQRFLKGEADRFVLDLFGDGPELRPGGRPQELNDGGVATDADRQQIGDRSWFTTPLLPGRATQV